MMPDEALTDYRSVIQQLMEGHLWLNETLGVQPTNAWVNDAFGYSGTFSYLLKRSGLNNAVLSRIHQAIKNTLQRKRSLEFYWQPYWKSGQENGLFCNVMPFEAYSSVCGPEQTICKQFDYMHPYARGSRTMFVSDRNIHNLATQLHRAYSTTAKLYRLNTLVVFIGEDNGFNIETSWNDTYNNYVKLIKHINNIPEYEMQIKFGTLQDYFTMLERKLRMSSNSNKTSVESPPVNIPTVSGDFFPYSDRNNDYWTGYFSNRPWLRRFSRLTESMLRAADSFSVLAYEKMISVDRNSFRDVFANLRSARRNISLYQHHDAIAGTCFPHVIKDFEKRLLGAYRNSLSALKVFAISLLTGEATSQNSLVETLELKNARLQPTINVLSTRDGSVDLVLLNPLFRSRVEVVAVHVTNPRVRIKDNDGKYLPIQVIQDMKQKYQYTIYFRVSLVPFAIKRVTIEPLPETDDTMDTHLKYIDVMNDDFTIENDYLIVKINSTGGSLVELCEKGPTEKCTIITSEFMAYKSKSSGAYVFGPAGEAEEIPYLWTMPDIHVQKGPLVTEVIFDFQSDFVQTLTLYNVKGPKGRSLHVSNKVQIPSRKVVNNTEVILRFKTDITIGDVFFTDQNGFQLIGRNNSNFGSPESSFYPMTNMAVLEDARKRLTLHSAQSLGVASLESGWVEVMLDRVMDRDDGKGLGMGIGDRVLSVTDFIIQIEHKPYTISIEEPRYTYPTTNSIVLNEQLQNNVILFSYFIHSGVKPTDYGNTATDIPCDLAIAGIKVLTNGYLSPVGISLITHRPAFHCHYPAKDLQCSTGRSNMNVKQFLEALGIYSKDRNLRIDETLLTHTRTLRPMRMCDSIVPDKNELRAFLISHDEH